VTSRLGHAKFCLAGKECGDFKEEAAFGFGEEKCVSLDAGQMGSVRPSGDFDDGTLFQESRYDVFGLVFIAYFAVDHFGRKGAHPGQAGAQPSAVAAPVGEIVNHGDRPQRESGADHFLSAGVSHGGQAVMTTREVEQFDATPRQARRKMAASVRWVRERLDVW